MKPILEELIDHMQPEKLERQLFRGVSRDIGSKRVFGGQVLGQALSAAQSTIKDRQVHSLHAYFLRAGDINYPIVYEVDRARDGLSFSMRRVTAIQNGKQIFNLSASFQKVESGVEHQFDMPEAPEPESLMDSKALAVKLGDKLHPMWRDFYTRERPFEFRFTNESNMLAGIESSTPSTALWFRAVDKLPDDDALHRILLAYVSDYHLIRTATLPHGVQTGAGKLQMASLDHAMWFHRSARVDDWMLYAMDSPNSGGSRGLARGMIYSSDGTLVASTAQEGLVRIIQ